MLTGNLEDGSCTDFEILPLLETALLSWMVIELTDEVELVPVGIREAPRIPRYEAEPRKRLVLAEAEEKQEEFQDKPSQNHRNQAVRFKNYHRCHIERIRNKFTSSSASSVAGSGSDSGYTKSNCERLKSPKTDLKSNKQGF